MKHRDSWGNPPAVLCLIPQSPNPPILQSGKRGAGGNPNGACLSTFIFYFFPAILLPLSAVWLMSPQSDCSDCISSVGKPHREKYQIQIVAQVHGSTCADDLTKLVPSILMLRKLKASSLHYSGSNFIMRQKGYHSVSTTPNIWKSPTDLLARCEKHWSRAWRPLQITHLTIPNVKCKEKVFR